MTNILRRRVLKFGLGIITAASMPAIAPHSINLKDNLSAAEFSELKILHSEWVKQGNGEPRHVIADLQLESFGLGPLQNRFEQDFIQGKIFVVNGLILSFTEAAILAAIGSAV